MGNISDWREIFSTKPTKKTNSIVTKNFYHQGIKYSFNWAKNHHLEYQKQNLKCSRELWRYLNRINQHDYPQMWFNDPSIQRISNFRINKLQRGIVPKIGLQLIEEKIIEECYKSEIINRAKDVYNMFKGAGLGNPGHEPILKNILQEDKNAIAIEVPVWYDAPEKITGHIDLIKIDGDKINIIDLKPEGNFMRSIPQVAYYGLLVKRRLNIEVNCISFNNKLMWKYEPERLLKRTEEILSELNIKKFDWQDYIK